MRTTCEGCTIQSICTIYADMSKHCVHADITISKCKFRDSKLESSPVATEAKPNTINVTSKSELDPFTGKPKVDRDKITEISNKNRKEKEEAAKLQVVDKPKPKLEAKPLVLDHTCPGCGGSTFKEDHSFCDECGKDICSCCATVDGDTNKLLCPECWQNL